MVFSLYLNKHFQFLINTSPGFRTERILEASLVESTANLNDFEASLGRIDKVNQKLQECPDIETWSQSGSIIKGTSFTKTYYDDKDQAFELNSPIQFTSSFMKIYDLKNIVVDKVVIYKQIKGESNVEFEDLYSGYMYNMPDEILNLSVYSIGVKKENVLDIMVR